MPPDVAGQWTFREVSCASLLLGRMLDRIRSQVDKPISHRPGFGVDAPRGGGRWKFPLIVLALRTVEAYDSPALQSYRRQCSANLHWFHS